MNQNYSKISCFVEKNPKTIIKICGISKQNMWFSTASTYNSFHSSLPNFVFKNLPYFPKLPHFEQSQVTSPCSKPTKIQNSNQQRSMINPYLKCLVHSKSCTHPTPLISTPKTRGNQKIWQLKKFNRHSMTFPCTNRMWLSNVIKCQQKFLNCQTSCVNTRRPKKFGHQSSSLKVIESF
jgi:hypothetical protein